MLTNSYTEEEFKQVLKNLFAEKKKVKELEKLLEEQGIQKKFHAKLSDFHKLSLTEEYAKLKAAYFEKEKACEHYKNQFEKVRPALTKLVEDLKGAHVEITRLKQELEEVRQDTQGFNLKVQELEQAKNEIQRLEAERGRLIEKLADSISQMQRQTEMIKDLRSEIVSAHKKIQQLEGESPGCNELVGSQDEILQRCYLKMRELSSRHSSWLQEKDMLHAEIRKKNQESIIFQERVAKQKKQLFELQTQLQELQQMRTTYVHMTSTFASLKKILENASEFTDSSEDPQNSGD